MDEFKVRMLENRMQIIENQTIMLNNLYVQNQTQMAFRERRLLINSQISVAQTGLFPPGYVILNRLDILLLLTDVLLANEFTSSNSTSNRKVCFSLFGQ